MEKLKMPSNVELTESATSAQRMVKSWPNRVAEKVKVKPFTPKAPNQQAMPKTKPSNN